MHQLSAGMAEVSSSLASVLSELKLAFGYTSFKSSVQKRAVLSIVDGKSDAS